MTSEIPTEINLNDPCNLIYKLKSIADDIEISDYYALQLIKKELNKYTQGK